jgi:hypothetical protein
VIDEQSVDRQQQIDHAGADQVPAGASECPREHQASDAERQVHDVVQDRNAENAKQFRSGVMAGEVEHLVVRRDAGNETQHAGKQERHANDVRRDLHGRQALTGL